MKPYYLVEEDDGTITVDVPAPLSAKDARLLAADLVDLAQRSEYGALAATDELARTARRLGYKVDDEPYRDTRPLYGSAW